jgi:hypothetical protein
MKIERTIRLTTRDWTGDGIVTVIAGVLVAVAVVLPWANERAVGSRVSYALTRPDDINGALATPWGPPMLIIAMLVIVLGATMIWLGPHRLALASGLLIALSGVGVCILALRAAREALMWEYAAGSGLMLALLVGLLLVPIGVASAMVGHMLRRQTPGPEAPAA